MLCLSRIFIKQKGFIIFGVGVMSEDEDVFGRILKPGECMVIKRGGEVISVCNVDGEIKEKKIGED